MKKHIALTYALLINKAWLKYAAGIWNLRQTDSIIDYLLERLKRKENE